MADELKFFAFSRSALFSQAGTNPVEGRLSGEIRLSVVDRQSGQHRDRGIRR
jgi:hypothetical protein